MTATEYQQSRRTKAQARWFAILAMKRKGHKWREVAAHFGLDTAYAFRLAQQAIEIELRNKL